MNSVERWGMLMNFCGQNDSALCRVPKGISVLLNFLEHKPTTAITKPKNLQSLPLVKTRYYRGMISNRHYLEQLCYLVVNFCSVKTAYS